MRPRVSVIMPTFNQVSRIDSAIESVLAQTFKDYELIVVDDGCTDGTEKKIVEALKAGRVSAAAFHGQNRGAAEAINTGAERATGKFMTWVSSDNLMDPKWLEVLLGRMKPGVGVVYSAYTRFGGSLVGRQGRPYDPKALISSPNCYFGPSFLIKAELWRDVGPLRGRISCDYDHWLRIEESCWEVGADIVYVDESLCQFYAGPERSSVRDAAQYDARRWQAEAVKRRARA